MTQMICENVSLGYEGKAVVSNLSFKVESGDYLCVVGENGAGKSTLIKTILSLDQPLSGKIVLSGGLKRSEIGYLPQQTLAQKDFPASVYEVVISGCLNRCSLRPFYNKREKALAEKSMKRLGIEDLKRQCYRELSGGQQQRVLLARALCAANRLLILDEPVSGLDPVAASEMYNVIKTLNKKDAMTVIMVSHDISAAVKYASSILHMSHKPIFFSSVDSYVRSTTGRNFIAGNGGTGNGGNNL